MRSRASASDRNHEAFRDSARRRPLKASCARYPWACRAGRSRSPRHSDTPTGPTSAQRTPGRCPLLASLGRSSPPPSRSPPASGQKQSARPYIASASGHFPLLKGSECSKKLRSWRTSFQGQDQGTAQALDRRTYARLAQSLPPARKGQGKPQPQGTRLPPPRLHPDHVAKISQSIMMFPNRLSDTPSMVRRGAGRRAAQLRLLTSGCPGCSSGEFRTK